MVTAGGKTTFAEMCILEARKRWPDLRFNILVPTIALLDQWYVGLQEELRVPSDEISVHYGQYHSLESKSINLYVLPSSQATWLRC